MAEDKKLLEMIKRSLVAEVKFPDRGGKIKFDVIGDTKKDTFERFIISNNFFASSFVSFVSLT